MGKKGFTKEGLEAMGLKETSPGVYAREVVKLGGGQVVTVDILKKEKVNNSPDFTAAPVTEWFIPYQVPSKKNSRQNFTTKTGKQISIPSKRYKDYITVTKKYWEVFGLEFNQTISRLDLKWPLDIHMTFIRSTKQVVDYFGPGESVFDLMTDFHWWPDDSHRYGKPHFGNIEVDKNNPGVRIKILLK
jgi:hypothetical protein